jgi:hypothetical protein
MKEEAQPDVVIKSQCDRIIEIVERDGQIDNFRCIHEPPACGSALAFKISEERGWRFRTERRSDKNYIYHVLGKAKPVQLAIAV